jgi:hypothetical protein
MNAVSPPTDPAIERLNYRNGQRIEAADLRVEQAYVIGVRRWLNRALYTPGIAKGLEVAVHPTNKHLVTVSPGLAFDVWGREIILPAPTEVWATGVPSTAAGVVFGNYLVIEYAEQRTGPGEIVCAGGTAPTRIRAMPRLSMQDAWPTLDSGKIPLAQIELRAGCEVEKVHAGIRKYVSSSKPPKVRPLALEGEKDIDATNRKLLNFHIAGSYPDSATLFLQATRFSTLFYSEMGRHGHAINLTTSSAGAANDHRHDVKIGDIKTSAVGDHRHEIVASTEDDGGALELHGPDTPNDLLTGPGGAMGGSANMEVRPAGAHDHTLAAGTVQSEPAGGAGAHTHSVSGQSGLVGQTGSAPRSGGSYSFFTGLRIRLDGVDITTQVLDQVRARRPSSEDWTQLGDGSQGHAMVVSGTGEIDLLQLGLDLGPRPHTLEFIPTTGGGQLHYNLYVE